MKYKVHTLQKNANKYGDYFVQTLFPNGTRSTWQSVMEINHDLDTQIWRLKQATDRTLYPCELVLDIDPWKHETQLQLLERVKKIVSDFSHKNIDGTIYSSGGSGFHAHFIFYELAMYSKYERQGMRRKLLTHYGCDTNLASDRHMILIEGEKNRKTGLPKRLVLL